MSIFSQADFDPKGEGRRSQSAIVKTFYFAIGRGIQRGLGFFLFCFMASTGAGSSPVFGGSFVSLVVKSIAILSDPIPTMIRWVFLSRAIILLFGSWIGTTLGVIDMHTAWRMLAAHCQSLHSPATDLSHNSCSCGSTAEQPKRLR